MRSGLPSCRWLGRPFDLNIFLFGPHSLPYLPYLISDIFSWTISSKSSHEACSWARSSAESRMNTPQVHVKIRRVFIHLESLPTSFCWMFHMLFLALRSTEILRSRCASHAAHLLEKKRKHPSPTSWIH